MSTDALRQILALKFADRALEKRGVHFEPHSLDLTTLFPAQQIPGTTEFKIKRGNLKSGAEVGKFLQGREPSASDRSELLFCRNQ